MKLGNLSGLLTLLAAGYIISTGSGYLLCSIGGCEAAYSQISGKILQTVWAGTVVAWLLIRDKEKEEK